MIQRIIEASVQQRVLVLLLSAILVVIGLQALRTTPVDAIPDLSDVQVIVRTPYPGQAPEVVQEQVTYPLTSALMSVPGAKTVRGYSFFGDSFVYVIFDDNTDLYWARSRVLEYLNQANDALPDGVKPALGPDASGVGWVYLYALQDTSGQHDLADLRDLQDWFLRYELQTVAGVSEVAALGGMQRQFQLRLKPQRLMAHGLSVAQVITALQQANQDTGASVVELAEAEYMLRSHGLIRTADDLLNIGISHNNQGLPVLVRDIADVLEVPQMRRGIAELNGQGEVVGGIIVMRSGENARAVISAVKDKLQQLKSSLPEGVEVVPVYDRTALIDRAVNNLWHKLSMEFVMVALVCALFLFHLRSSLVIVLSLPLGILAAFVFMRWQGINANIMSLGGIAIAIGAMVDGAIVMIENYHKYLERYPPKTDTDRWQGVISSAQQVGPALFFSLLIITLSFIPVFMLEAQEGRLFAPLAYTKTYAMAAAAMLAITLVPVLIGYLVRGPIKAEKSNPLNRVLTALYTPVLKQALHFPKTTLLLVIVMALSAWWPMKQLGSEFMPPLDEGDLMYMPTTYPGLSVAEARQILQQTDRLIGSVPEVANVLGKIGRADSATDPAPLTMIESFIQLKPREQWRDGVTLDDIKQELDRKVQFPGLSNAWVMPIRTRIDMLATGIKTPVGIKIAGDDLNQIQAIGQQLETLMADVPGTTSVYAERTVSGRYLDIRLRREQLARFGLTVQQAQQLLATAVGGKAVTQAVDGLRRYPVSVRLPQRYRDSPEALKQLMFYAPNGQLLALADIAEINIAAGPAMIKSENARINGWVFIDIAGVDLGRYVEQAQQHVQTALADGRLQMPAGYSLNWSGQYEYLLRAQNKLQLAVPLTLVIVAVLLYLAFQRLRDVALILLTVPLSLVGSVWLLWALDFHLSVAVGVGFIALAGVAVEIGVIMLVYLQQAWQQQVEQQQGRQQPLTPSDVRTAVLQGAGQRLRPIAMTVATIAIGLLPVMLGQGTGSEVMSRIAAPMVGGAASALLLTLLVLPVLFYWLTCWQLRHHNHDSA
ncbi:CusA/CzcA family heavy metal efflux RND transporter [Bacterioplanes sanyensis]|uniref:CusA/CzcA family heavy metal efflux RND transporter n=1 Tax=Bacterioplanes sanyensis TaxID=1249553 RepID=A0A222FF91_9GAMM|nr:CusA/CzcA family heavy metal efflux RND transporter [Bacterioplanes sanyensis]ASP37164.1 CusA/CzcA family heavy metal efflux RND transporter [Bacterioplanes sanyensis]ASP40762.1 CusA/CzcA family heavy metal efflux RND transporter [Bacterioplanes sanyensis]